MLVVARPAQAAIAAARLRREPSIAVVQPRAAVSPDGRFVLVTASFHAGTGDHPAVAKRLAATLPGEVGGTAVANEEVRTQSEHDLLRAELIAFPLLFLLALWVFRGVVAAALPLLAGGLSIVITLALIRVINDVTPISVFALNLVTGAGLGLAIDYSLLLVSRYREELVRHGPGIEALRATLRTAGRTVAFSAVTVAAAFASLLVFPLGFLRSMALGGLIIAPLAGARRADRAAGTLRPARHERERARAGRWQRAAERAARPDERGGWYRFAHWVMRHPLPIAITSATVLIALGLPFLHARFIGVDASVLPPSAHARAAGGCVAPPLPARRRLTDPHRRDRRRPRTDAGGDPARCPESPPCRRHSGSARGSGRSR